MHQTSELLFDKVNQQLGLLNNPIELAIGLSGGVDSVVLLHILNRLKNIHDFKLSAIHINHGISNNANYWEAFCKNYCHVFQIPIIIYQTNIIKAGGESLENIARNFRIQSFTQHPSKIIVLAHHLNDQIETMLGQIMRGSDLHNIAAMKIVSQKLHKTFWRPLLNSTRDEILKYALDYNLEFIEDESNLNIKFLRNFTRHKLLPELKNWDTNIVPKLQHLINHIQDTVTFLDEIAKTDLQSCISTNITHPDFQSLDLKQQILQKKFMQLSIKRQINLISYFIKLNNLPLPSNRQIKEFCTQVCTASWDKKPSLLIESNITLCRTKGYIFIKHFIKT